MKKTLIALFATAGVIAGVSAASAEQTTNTLTVLANYKHGCTISFDSNDNTVNFGTFSDVNQLSPQTRNFSVGCSKGYGSKGVKVGLSAGNIGTDTVDSRAMYHEGNTANRLQFQVYKGSSVNDSVWGDLSSTGTATPYNVTMVAGKTEKQPFTVAVLKNQDLKGFETGEYRQVMVATVDYDAPSAP